jgi:NifU-like protein involved in Fe-S cluster formation
LEGDGSSAPLRPAIGKIQGLFPLVANHIPPFFARIHCSVLGDKALRAAIDDYLATMPWLK